MTTIATASKFSLRVFISRLRIPGDGQLESLDTRSGQRRRSTEKSSVSLRVGISDGNGQPDGRSETKNRRKLNRHFPDGRDGSPPDGPIALLETTWQAMSGSLQPDSGRRPFDVARQGSSCPRRAVIGRAADTRDWGGRSPSRVNIAPRQAGATRRSGRGDRKS